MNHPLEINWQDSVIETIHFKGRDYLLKRDDLLSPIGGNKARKLHGLLQQDLSQYQAISSHGGAQSNAMLSLAQLCQLLNIPFHYYSRPVPKWLKQTPLGNLRAAIDCGMQWHITEDGLPPENLGPNNLLIPQGISMPEARLGLELLAAEIEAFCRANSIEELAVVTPSGTGATALYLQQHLSHTVYTVPCIGDQETLMALFKQALPDSERYPTILNTQKRYHFGEPHPELLAIYQSLLSSTGIEFELMYDAKTWLVLADWQYDKPILYLHNGGVSGNESMLARYRRLATQATS